MLDFVSAEPSVQVAYVGIITTFIASFTAVIVAIVNNRKERRNSAESVMEASLRERILLRDEQIMIRDQKIEELEKSLQTKDHEYEKLQELVELYKDGRAE